MHTEAGCGARGRGARRGSRADTLVRRASPAPACPRSASCAPPNGALGTTEASGAACGAGCVVPVNLSRKMMPRFRSQDHVSGTFKDRHQLQFLVQKRDHCRHLRIAARTAPGDATEAARSLAVG